MGGGSRGGGRSQNAQMRGADLRYNLTISLEEAFRGKQQKIQFTSATECNSCKGTGSKGGKSGINTAAIIGTVPFDLEFICR